MDCFPDDWLYLFVAIDRTSKFAFTRLVEKAGKMVAAQFLRDLLAAVPYRLHTVLTDNGIQFTTPGTGGSAVPLIKEAIANGHAFVDGNKRTSFVATELFLSLNDHELQADDAECVMTWLALADGSLTEAELTDWLRHHRYLKANE